MVQPSKTFGERLVAAGAERGRLCVGIDPHAHLLQAWGLNNDVDGLRTFARTCVEAFADTVAVVKPQVAFFERFGSAGALQYWKKHSRAYARPDVSRLLMQSAVISVPPWLATLMPG